MHHNSIKLLFISFLITLAIYCYLGILYINEASLAISNISIIFNLFTSYILIVSIIVIFYFIIGTTVLVKDFYNYKYNYLNSIINNCKYVYTIIVIIDLSFITLHVINNIK